MSKQWSDLGAEDSSRAVKNGSWEESAVATDEAAPFTEREQEGTPVMAVDVAGDVGADIPQVEADVEAEVEVAATADAAPEPAAAVVEAPISDDQPAEAEAAVVDDSVAFLSELARAMQATAASERVRIDAEIEQRRGAHVDRIRARQSSEADRMRELAAEELQSIDIWAEREVERIREEQAKRAAALDEDLATSLAEHGAQADAEIARVESAIESHRAAIDAFFADLDSETDVVVLAQRATQRPAFPDLDLVANGIAASPVATDAGEATAMDAVVMDAASEPPAAVGVMDPAAIGETAGETWETAGEQDEAPRDQPAGDADALREDGVAPEPVAVGADEPARKSLFQSVQVVHPTTWLHRNRNGEDDSA